MDSEWAESGQRVRDSEERMGRVRREWTESGQRVGREEGRVGREWEE